MKLDPIPRYRHDLNDASSAISDRVSRVYTSAAIPGDRCIVHQTDTPIANLPINCHQSDHTQSATIYKYLEDGLCARNQRWEAGRSVTQHLGWVS